MPPPSADRYRENRTALLERHPHLRPVLPADLLADPAADLLADPATDLSTDPCADPCADPAPPDAYVLRRDGGAPVPVALPDIGGAARGGFLVYGVPAPRLLAHLLALAGPHGYRPPVDVIEPDGAALGTWLRLVEPHLLRDGRVTIFAGPRAGADYADFRVAHLGRRDPTHILRCARPGWAPPRGADDPGRRASAAAESRRRELRVAQDAYYDDATPARCAARFRRFRDEGAPLSILGITTVYSTVVERSLRDLAAAFRRRGCVFDVVTEQDRSSNDVDTWSALARRPYDLVVLVNTLRGQIADRLHERVPCAAWIQDHVAPLATRAAGRAVGPFDRVLCQRPWNLATRFEYPVERLVATSPVAGADPFDGTPPTARELAAFRCDVSYASHASAPVERLVAELAAPKGADFRAFLVRIVDGLRAEGAAHRRGIPFDVKLEIALRAEQATPALRLAPAERAAGVVPLVECLADRLFRHEALAWTARWARRRGREFRIYGNGWETHPTLASHARGAVENGRPLACLARASAVNLQINGYGSLHPRLLDALAAGGFVLSRANDADFARPPMTALAAYVEREGIGDLAALLARAGRDPELDGLLARFRALGLFNVAPASDPARRREERLLREVYDFPAGLLTDEARFEAIRTAAPAPPRGAGDLPGFETLAFDDEATLHALLDAFMDDPVARAAHAAPQRAAVLAQDTSDAVADRIVAAFCETA